MRILFSSLLLLIIINSVNGQKINDRLEKAFQKFTGDEQLSNAISSIYVIDAETGEVIVDKNSRIGMAGASTQKVITAATAFDILGKNFRYQTSITRTGNVLFVKGAGDPTFGSNRYPGTKEKIIFQRIIDESKKAGLNSIREIHISSETEDLIPPGAWVNEDLGNYYGAGSQSLNWKENQYDLVFTPGKKPGDPTRIDSLRTSYWNQIINHCKTGAAGSGDNAYVYFIPASEKILVKGTIPIGPERFTIAGADPWPAFSMERSFYNYAGNFIMNTKNNEALPDLPVVRLMEHYSPALDSISYWFLNKSINLYGEALINTLGLQRKNISCTDSGILVVKEFWKEKGIDPRELNIYDGSGLSPLNRLTTHAQVEVLKYAKKQSWFPEYFAGFPEYNGMKIKSGTINDVKGYCGYHTSKEGKQYIFSFLVNNYNGKSSTLVAKMFKVLDEMK